MAGNLPAGVAVLTLIAALAAAVIEVVRLRLRQGIATPNQRATYEVLGAAGLAAQPLRTGLTAGTAAKAVPHLRTLTGAAGIAIVAGGRVLAFDGVGAHHADQLAAAAERILASGRSGLLGAADLPCDQIDCPVRGAVLVPLRGASGSGGPGSGGSGGGGSGGGGPGGGGPGGGEYSGPAGALAALCAGPPAPGLLQAAVETARWVGTQLALAELDSARARLARAEVRALRAQIRPHFVYNALTAIASFVRTDPERARELILEFAEFTRYSFRSHGEFTTLAEELRSIDRYLMIERARFGERLQVRLEIAPEVLPVTLPFLCLQPLVENAVRHGLSPKPGVGTISIVARDAGAHCQITVEDDGVGMDPAVLARPEPDDDAGDAGQHVGLSNVDDRLRVVFGDRFGLIVETAPGAGTRVSMRVPKFSPTVRAGPAGTEGAGAP